MLGTVPFQSSAENEKKMPPEKSQVSRSATSNITHSANADQDSSRVATTFNAHCTVHCATEDVNINFANHDTKNVRYRTVLCA